MKLSGMEEEQHIGNGDKADIPLLPDFCNAGVVLIAVIGAELLALVLALIAADTGRDFWSELAIISLLSQWVVLGISLVLCLLRTRLNRLSGIQALMLIYGLIILVALLMGVASIMLASTLDLYVELAASHPEWFLFKLLGISGIVGAVLLRYLYVQQQWRLHVHAQARARVQALQARIRPHFLFNSMNTISSLIRGRPRDAEQAVEDLSELFRASLKAEEFIPLRDELGITRNYLDIEHLRIGDRLRVSWSVDEQVDLDIPVPCLSLQPLVENAVYHGIEPRIEGGEISISVGKRGEQLFIQVRNPLPDKAHLRRGHHMAQDNIRQRLELSYGQRAGLEVKELEQAYEVVLSLPSRGAFE